jgi:hypothetical protein
MTLLAFVTEGYVIYPLAYLELMPDFMCVANGQSFHCSNEDTCSAEFNMESNGQTNGYYVNWNN